MSSTRRYDYGTLVGTGALLTQECTFKPDRIVLRNDNGIMLEWNRSLPAGYAHKTIANGTRSLVTSNGITPVAGGFTLGTDSINGNGETIRFEIFGG